MEQSPCPSPLRYGILEAMHLWLSQKGPLELSASPPLPPPPLSICEAFFSFFLVFFCFYFFFEGGGELQMPTVGQGRGRGRVERKLLSTLPPSVDYG